MKTLLHVLAGLLLFAVAACAGVTPQTPRERLAAAELSYQAALSEIRVLADAGLIKGNTAATTAASVRTVDAAIAAWRLNPDSPDYMAAANSALAPLLKLITTIRGSKSASLEVDRPPIVAARPLPALTPWRA